MSLHQLAQHMQSAGRGDDKMLVHMTPGEVHGLQKLAMANGGSLTINPETGLPEAGILSTILPMIAGFALGPAGIGMTAMNAALTTGAIGTLATGSLSKGLMMGLGAYGGAGLGGGLESLGSAAAGAGGTTAGTAAGSAAGSAAGVNTTANAMLGQTMAPVTGAATGSVGAIPGISSTGSFEAFKPASLGQSPMLHRGAAAQRLVPEAVLNSGELNSISTAVTPAEALSVRPDISIDMRALDVPIIKTGSYGQIDATTQRPFASGNIAPVSAPPPVPPMASPQPSMDATTQQLFRTPSPYTPPRPGDATASRLFENQSPYTGQAPGDATRQQLFKKYTGGPSTRSLPSVEDRSDIQKILRNASDTPNTPSNTMKGLKQVTSGGMQGLKDLYGAMDKKDPYSAQALGLGLLSGMDERFKPPKGSKALIRPYTMKRNRVVDSDVGPSSSAERRYFNDVYTAGTPYEAPGPEYRAAGGIVALADGGELPQYEYLGNNQYKLKNPVATTAAPKVSPTGQPVDAYGGYIGPYGQYMNSQGVAQPYYMNPTMADDSLAMKARADAGVSLPSKTAATPPVSTVEGLNELYQEQFGRAADPSAIESYMGKGYTPEQITGFLQSSEEYAPIKTRLAEEAKQATYADPTQIANIYSDVLGRNPDMAGLDYYTGQNLTPDEVKQQLMQSEEYKTNLTKPFVPAISYTGNRLSYDDINKQLGHNATYEEVKAAGEAFVPNRATIEGAPQYQTPEQRLGLAPNKPRDQTPDFYAMMDQRLAEQAKKAGGGMIQVPDAVEMYANGGGIQGYNLGGYSDGGRLLRGPGDGVSDSIPASIGNRQPARLADGEFVIPARIVSELGNGSTEAGAKRLYAMMDRVQKARRKTVGKGKVAVNSKADKHLPA